MVWPTLNMLATQSFSHEAPFDSVSHRPFTQTAAPAAEYPFSQANAHSLPFSWPTHEKVDETSRCAMSPVVMLDSQS